MGRDKCVEGYSMITRNPYRSLCHIKGEPLAISRVVYVDKKGRHYINYYGSKVYVTKRLGRYYETEADRED